MTKVTDPVCGMTIKIEKAVGQTEYEGATYYFCTEACKQQFLEQPERYVGKESAQN